MSAAARSRFQAALVRGMRASPFEGLQDDAPILIKGTVRTKLVGCVFQYSCSAAPLEEVGIRPGHRLKVHVLKSVVRVKPDHALDRLEYQGRVYNFDPAAGTEAYSPVWVLNAFSPLS